jgi:hypothetical protein
MMPVSVGILQISRAIPARLFPTRRRVTLRGPHRFTKPHTSFLAYHFIPSVSVIFHCLIVFFSQNTTHIISSYRRYILVMFAPALLVVRHIPVGIGFMLTGPILAAWITPSMNEQASIWCFFSVFQCLAYTAIAFLAYDKDTPALLKVAHKGGFGERRMEYELVKNFKNGVNVHSLTTGKKHS